MLLRKALLIAILTTLAEVIQSQQIPKSQLISISNINPPVAALSLTTSSKCPSNNNNQHDICPQSNIAHSQDITSLENFKRISKGAQKFALEFLTQMSDLFHQEHINHDYMISPFSVWALLSLLTEAASGRTLSQLRTTLHIQDEDQLALRGAFSGVKKYLQLKTSTIEIASFQALFIDRQECLDENYKSVVESCYGGKVESVRFDQVQFTTNYIQNIVEAATNKLITYRLKPEDLEEKGLLMISTLYFSGQWKIHFNTSLTRSEPFYDDHGTSMGNIEMMIQESNFKNTRMNELEGHVLELPYGNEDRFCMLIILPQKGVSINKVIHNLQGVGIEPIFAKLTAIGERYKDEEVELHLPKFTTTSDMLVNEALEKLGIVDVFDPRNANLSKLGHSSLFVSSITHNTKIIVNEVGTKAAGVTSAVLENKRTPSIFHLNRPFLYLVVDKHSNLLLFAGQISNPNKLSYRKNEITFPKE